MKIKVISLLIVLFLLFSALSFSTLEWNEIRSEHFIVYFQGQARDFADDVSTQAEEYYDSIAQDLGYVRYGNFWKWGNRVKIYLYPDHSSYIKASGMQDWSQGVADYKNKQIASYVKSFEFLNTLLVHEITHLIFRDFVGFKSDIPLWLDEGVAQWEEKNTRELRMQALKGLAEKKHLFSLNSMMKLDIRKVNVKEKIIVERLDAKSNKREKLTMKGDEAVEIYYLQAFSLVGFLISRFGSDNFIVFSRQLRDGKNINEALTFAYPTNLRSLEELEEGWKEYISQ